MHLQLYYSFIDLFPGSSVVKNLTTNTGDTGDVGSILGSGRSPGGVRSKPTPVFLPGESHGQGSLAGYIQSMGSQESDTTEQLSTAHT